MPTRPISTRPVSAADEPPTFSRNDSIGLPPTGENDKAVPDSPFPSQQVDHVVVRSGGRIIGPDGKPIVGTLKENPDAHIPLSDWLNWTSGNSP